MKNKYGSHTRVLVMRALIGITPVALVVVLWWSRPLNTCQSSPEKECPACPLPPMSSPVPVTALQPPPVKPLPRSLPPVKPCAAGSLFLGVLCVPNTIHTENTSCGLEEPTSFDGGDDFCRFYTPLTGIVRITQTRWQAAQSVESSVWRYFQGEEDRNDQHSYWFELYLAVDGKKMGHVLEIGSGPFTETKTVLDTVRSRGLDPLVESITLADPLMIYYHTHVASCSYKDGSLMGYPTRFIAAGGEDLHLRDVFDTVIMINVLEHCHDALRVLRTLHESVRPAGGLLIFSERWYDHKWSQYEKQPVPFWDMMHPINVKRAVIEALLDLYEPLYRRDFFYEKSYPTDEGVYFIGLKK